MPESGGATLLDIDILLRAFAICGVVVVHAGNVFELFGGPELLFLLAGYNFARFQSKVLFEGHVSMLMLFVPKVSISGTARRLVASISGACFYIYMVHGVPVALLRMPDLGLHPTVRIYPSLLLSVLLGTALAGGMTLVVRLPAILQSWVDSYWNLLPLPVGHGSVTSMAERRSTETSANRYHRLTQMGSTLYLGAAKPRRWVL